mgnify:CR=1 FL=1
MPSSVLFVDVLNDLFTPVVLDVEIDVRRLCTLDAQEAFEQEIHSNGIDRGDVQTETHRAVGRASAPLTQDVVLPAVLNDFVHGQKVAAVAQLSNDAKLALDLRANVCGYVAPVSSSRTGERQLTQPALLGATRRQTFFWVSIANVVEAEVALIGDVERAPKTRRVVGEQAR